MKIAIVGFPGCGKSTCFKAITQKNSEETEKLDPTKPHLGAVKIPDNRLDKLKSIFNPKKLIHSEIIFEDIPSFHVPDIKEVEALVEVLGVFSGRDAAKDVEGMDTEFMLADLEIISRRLPGLEKELMQEDSREKTLEKEVLIKCKASLEKSVPLRDIKLTFDEEKQIRGFQFLSKKTVFVIINIDESQKSNDALKKAKAFCEKKGFKFITFCAKLEAEIADLEESEKASFLKELGEEGTSRDVLIELAYKALGYITFFTTKSNQTKAWSVKKGITAIDAAGKIHSDIQKGFIKAEVVSFKDLEASGSVGEAKKKALLRLEGKEYKITDGDIIDFRFNV